MQFLWLQMTLCFVNVVFNAEDYAVIKNLNQYKGYGAKKLITNFQLRYRR